MTYFPHSYMEGHSGCFPVLGTMNNGSVHSLKSFYRHELPFLSGKYEKQNYGGKDECKFHFMRNCQTVPSRVCTF
jgi:hypothetical protein